MSVTDVGADKRIFLRKASGLIRTAGLADTFIYNLGVVSIGLGVGSMLYYGPAFYPQGNLIWGCIIAGIAMAMISFGFITWTVTLPRSGGIYVFGSRILPPSLALTMSLVEITAWLFYCAIAAYWMVPLALAPMFAGLELLTGNETYLAISKWMLQPWATFLIGSVILILSQIVLSYGMRFYLTLNKWVFIIAMASTVFLIVVLAMWIAGMYNGLVALRNRYKNAFAQIDVQLTRRYDLIPNLVEVAKKYLSHERETLEAVIRARNSALEGLKLAAGSPGNPAAMQSLEGAEAQLGGAMGRLFALAEAYPDLKANTTMMQLSEELTSTENKVAFARQAYNDSVMAYNNRREVFPSSLIAGTFDFAAAALLEITQPERREAVKVSFS